MYLGFGFRKNHSFRIQYQSLIISFSLFRFSRYCSNNPPAHDPKYVFAETGEAPTKDQLLVQSQLEKLEKDYESQGVAPTSRYVQGAKQRGTPEYTLRNKQEDFF